LAQQVLKAIIAKPPSRDSATLQDILEPTPGGNEVLLKILRLGIDGTDRDINEGFYGAPPEGFDYLVIGHEALCRVEQLGESVLGFKEDDLVVPTVRRPDDCINCKNGESDMCIKGNYKEHGIYKLHGFAAQFGKSDADFLVKIPKEIEEVAVLLEPLSIAEKALYQIRKIQQRMVWEPTSALVLGAGTLGLLTTLLLRVEGFDVTTLATRPKDSLKARIAEECGATYVNGKETPISSMEGKFDFVIEATGNPQVALDAISVVHQNGVVCFLGIYPQKVMSLDFGKTLTSAVLGNKLFFGSVNANKTYFESGVKHMEEMRKDYDGILEKLFTSVLKLEEYTKAFKPDVEEIKTVIEFSPI
jgi:threonine dehydrogenase-like Zn-dependent dehydrogenase